MLNWIIKLFERKKQEREQKKNMEGELYTPDEDYLILHKPSNMTYVELAEQMGRKAKSIRQRKYYLSIK